MECGGARSEDQALEQGIGRQAIGAVNAGASSFACGVKTAEAGAAAEIGADAAHEIVRRGANGDEVAAEVETVVREKSADAGKASGEIDVAHVTHVEIDRAWLGS